MDPHRLLNNDTFRAALPYIVIAIGTTFLAVAAFAMERHQPSTEFCSDLGKTLLAGGIFATLLKSYQFMGIFKEELSKVIYDAKFLKNRADLPEVWGNVSKVLFKNKFPKINGVITKDVQNLYFPTEYVLYYDRYKQLIKIRMLDDESQKVEVTDISEYTIYPTEPLAKTPLQANNWLEFDCDASEVSFKLVEFKVNGEDICSSKDFSVTSSVDASTRKALKTTIKATLMGAETYKVNSQVVKIYSLKTDNIISLTKEGIIHNLNVRIVTTGVKMTFKSAGTLKPFTDAKWGKDDCYEFDYEGIIYPNQGYHIFLEKKP